MRGTIKQAFKSWIYGGISIIFDFGIFWLLNHFLLTSLKTIPFNFGPFRYGIEDGGLCTFISTAVSYFISMIINYFVQRKYVFKANNNVYKGLILYMIVNFVFYLFNLLLPGFIGAPINNFVGNTIGPTVTKAISEFVCFILRFPIDKYLVMKKD